MEGKGWRLNHSAISTLALIAWSDFREAVPDNTTVNAFLELERGRACQSRLREGEGTFYKGNEHMCQVELEIPNRKTLSSSLRMSLPSSRTIFPQSVNSENVCAQTSDH